MSVADICVRSCIALVADAVVSLRDTKGRVSLIAPPLVGARFPTLAGLATLLPHDLLLRDVLFLQRDMLLAAGEQLAVRCLEPLLELSDLLP